MTATRQVADDAAAALPSQPASASAVQLGLADALLCGNNRQRSGNRPLPRTRSSFSIPKASLFVDIRPSHFPIMAPIVGHRFRLVIVDDRANPKKRRGLHFYNRNLKKLRPSCRFDPYTPQDQAYR